MDPPPITAAAAAICPVQQTHSTTDSVESSPRSRIIQSWEEGIPSDNKLRLMCSYGGHIIPRPHTKSLCYVGGETRLVVADRHSSLSDLSARLSRTLLNGRSFAGLKYQIPNEDLDSLISVATDEDLDNMIDEYDRTAKSPTRLRLFLFPAKPETATSMGNLLDNAKSDKWFVDALNGTSDFLPIPRGLSDSAAAAAAAIDSLLILDHDHNHIHNHNHNEADDSLVSNSNHNHRDSSLYLDLEPRHEAATTLCSNNNNNNNTSNSSFGSSSSSPSMSNLPPIRTRVDEGGLPNHDGTKFCFDGQFAQLGVSSNVQNQDDGLVSDVVVSILEKSEQPPVQARLRKPPLPLPLPLQHVQYNANNLLHSPDSIASENSLASISSLSTPMHQDPVHVGSRESKYSASPNDPKTDVSERNSQPQMQPAQESAYVSERNSQPQMQPAQESAYVSERNSPHLNQQHQQQQQYLQPGAHYIHHPGTGLVQVSPYYSMYAPPPMQQLHQRMEQQIPMYTMSLTQPQSYNTGLQDNNSSANLGRPLPPPNAVTVAQAATTFTESLPPVYPTKKVTETPQLVPNQIQQQYVGFSQMYNPAQSIASGNYAYEYSHPGYEQAFYTNHPASMIPAQYQTMNQSSAVYLSEAASPPQQHTENSK